jgi:S1-C subfamily serine protease
MKILIFTLLYSATILSRSVVPDRVILPPLDLYSPRNKTLENGEKIVKVTTFDKYGKFHQNGGEVRISTEVYQKYLSDADAVFEMIPSHFSRDEEKASRRGTAFSIGNNLVVTNLHVLDPSFENTTDCDDFEIKDPNGNKFSCKEVLFCSVYQDVCLIEMNIRTKTKRDCFFCSGIKYQISLADGASLKLSSKLPDDEKKNDYVTTAIGNSAGFGIHYSKGKGLKLINDQLRFYAPITNGNSGGPLLNEFGQVIGIVKRQTSLELSTDPNLTFNIATPVDQFIEAVREHLKNRPEILEKFNTSVVK